MIWTTARRRCRQPFLIATVIVLVAALYTGTMLTHVHRPAQYVIQPGASTPYLPFDMPTGATTKKVFAHYVPWVTISVDNQPYQRDYYTTQLITPTGEGGVHAAYGGLLRDRPIPRAPINDPNWRNIDLRTEVTQAKSIGIDGFAVDVLVPGSQSDAVTRVMDAAHTVGGFSIQVTPDMTGAFGSNYDEAAFAAEFAPYLRHAAVQRLTDGRVVFGAFYAERKPAIWWQNVLNILRDTYQLNVAFVPTFLDALSNLNAFAPFSYGLSNWGARNPSVVSPTDTAEGSPVDLVRRAKALGKLWMQPVAFQDNRPRFGIFEESQNAVTNRNGWQIAISQQAEWVNLITWNDYAETTAVAPSVRHGWRILDMDAYQIARYKFGVDPQILRDAVYVSHRMQPHAAHPTFPQTLLMRNIGPTPARDAVEVEAYSRAPSMVVADIGGASQTCNVPAGFGVCTFGLAPGGITVRLYRSNVDQVVVQSPYQVTNAPYVQDLQYVVAGGLR